MQLNDHGVSVEGSMEDYVDADEDLAVTGTFTDADIVDGIRGKTVIEEEDSEPGVDTDEPISCPSLSQFQSAINSFLIHHLITQSTLLLHIALKMFFSVLGITSRQQ